MAEGQDCYNQILNGINNVIRTHINEIHSKFEAQFSSMTVEVEKRDALIAHLQSKLKTLELNASFSSRRKTNREKMSGQCSEGGAAENPNVEDNSSSGSSAELLFMVKILSFSNIFTNYLLTNLIFNFSVAGTHLIQCFHLRLQHKQKNIIHARRKQVEMILQHRTIAIIARLVMVQKVKTVAIGL